MEWRLDNSEECGSRRKKSETNPPTHHLPFHNRKTSRNNLTGLQPVEYVIFPLSPFPLNSLFLSILLSFFIPSSFHPLFFIPYSCFLLFTFLILIFVKIPSYYLSSNLFFIPSSFLPSIPFLFLFPSFPSPFFSFFLLFPQVRQ